MGTVNTKLGNIFSYIKTSYKQLGEYDVDEIDFNEFNNADISRTELADLKKAMAEVDEMEKSYSLNFSKKSKRKKAVVDVSRDKKSEDLIAKKSRKEASKEKDRED
ncbi:MAG: hypothetical protein IKG56_03580 [Clostridia bacterium]|nr:hypothetical protein [Clostridia bacterium]